MFLYQLSSWVLTDNTWKVSTPEEVKLTLTKRLVLGCIPPFFIGYFKIVFADTITLYLRQPVRLPVMLRGDCQRVQEDQDQNHPIEGDRLNRQPTFPPESSVPSLHLSAGKRSDVGIIITRSAEVRPPFCTF